MGGMLADGYSQGPEKSKITNKQSKLRKIKKRKSENKREREKVEEKEG